MKKLFRKIASTVLAVILATSSSVFFLNNAKVNAANFGNYTVVAENVPVSWVSSHSLSTAISNTLSAAGAPIPSGRDGVANTGNYSVDGNSGFMCITSSASSPSQSPSSLGKVYRCVNQGVYDNSSDSADPYGVLSRLSGKSYSQIVYGCLCAAQRSNDGWNMAHAILSHLIGSDNSWFGPLANSEVRNLVEAFAKTATGYATSSFDNPFYVFVPNDGNGYQCLISSSYTPTPRSMSVSFYKTDGVNLISGAVIQFYSTSEGTNTRGLDVQVHSSVGDLSNITNGIQFTTTGQGITIVGLKANSTYVFHEVTPPAGYQIADDITVTVDANGKVTSSQGSSTVTMIDNPLSSELIFNKREENRDNPVVGAVIQLRPADESNAIPEDVSWMGSAASNIHRTSEGYIEFTTTDSTDNQLVLTGLPIGGSFYFAEVYVPEGYRIAQDMYFTVNNDGTIPEQVMIDELQAPAPGYGDLRICKEYSDDFASDVSIVYFYVYYNHEVDGTAYPFNRGYRIQNGQNDTWIASGYLITGNNQHEVWWNMVHDDLLYGGESGINNWRTYSNDHGRYYTMEEMTDRYWLQWLPYGRYTVVEVWCDPSIEGDDVSTRLYQQALNVSGWREIDTLDISESGTRTDAVDGRPTAFIENSRWHRYATDVVITEGSTSHSLTGDAGNNNYDEYVNNPNTGAVWLRNDTTGATVDLEKITRDTLSLADLHFELWSTGTNGFRLATGVIDGSSGIDNHYNVTWNYNIRVSNTEGGHGSIPGTEDLYNSPGQSAQAIYTSVNVTRARVSGLPAGTYEFREYATGSTSLNNYAVPEGWSLVTDSTGTYFSKFFTVTETGAATRQQINETIRNDCGSITVYKVDAWSGAVLAGYEGSNDATFALYEDNNNNGTLDAGDTLVATLADTDRDGIVAFDFTSVYSSNIKISDIPNSFLILETVAPMGYYLNSNPIAVNLTTYQRTASVTCEDTPYTAHITVHKLDGDTVVVLAGAIFDVYVDVDNNGLWNPDIDTLAKTYNGTGMANVSFTYDEVSKTYVSSELRPGNYILVETQAPSGYYFTDGNGNVCEGNNVYAFTISNADPNAADFTVGNVETTLYNKKPSVRTTLTGNGSHEVGLSDSITLVDVVEYTNLFTDRDYTVTGVLMNKATGQPVLDANGNQIASTVTFRPATTNGTVNVTFEVNTNYLYNTANAPQIVCFETIRQNGVDIAIHADINDVDQTVYVNNPPPPPVPTPGLRTTATDASTGSHTFAQTSTAQVIDVVEYTNLNVGQTYTVTGTLQAVVFDSDGNANHVGPLVQNGQPVVAEVTFVPTTSSGTVEVRFNVDVTDLMARHIGKVVVFEDLWYNGFRIATHSDINDEGQTVTCDTPGNSNTPTPIPTLTPIPTPWSPGIPSTGENMSVETWVGTILLTVGSICILIIIHKRFKETKF